MGSIGKFLAGFLAPTAAEVIESAIVAGGVTALTVVAGDLAKVVNADAMGGLLMVAASMIIKALQKKIAVNKQTKG